MVIVVNRKEINFQNCSCFVCLFFHVKLKFLWEWQMAIHVYGRERERERERRVSTYSENVVIHVVQTRL